MPETSDHRHDVHLVDTTLRDGIQAPGVVFSTEEKCCLATALDAAGIAEIEAGIPIADPAVADDIRALISLGLRARLTGWCRLRGDDLDAAAACGLTAVHLSLPASSRLCLAFGHDPAWWRDQLVCLVPRACARFRYVSIGLQDIGGATVEEAVLMARLAVANGAHRIRLADSNGALTPHRVAQLVTAMRLRVPPTTWGFHAHNDLGLATANTLAAFEAGASHLDVTVNGLGERAGNARLAEVATTLQLALGCDSGLNLRALPLLSRLVANSANRPVPADMPLVGRDVFRHTSGLHAAARTREPDAYQVCPPTLVGRPVPVQADAGAMSGRQALAHALLAATGKLPTPEELAALLPHVHAAARNRKRSLRRAELLSLYQEARKQQSTNTKEQP